MLSTLLVTTSCLGDTQPCFTIEQNTALMHHLYGSKSSNQPISLELLIVMKRSALDGALKVHKSASNWFSHLQKSSRPSLRSWVCRAYLGLLQDTLGTHFWQSWALVYWFKSMFFAEYVCLKRLQVEGACERISANAPLKSLFSHLESVTLSNLALQDGVVNFSRPQEEKRVCRVCLAAWWVGVGGICEEGGGVGGGRGKGGGARLPHNLIFCGLAKK